MRVLLRDKANTIREPLPGPAVASATLAIYDASTGSSLASIAGTVQGVVATTTDAALTGDAEISVDATVPAGYYFLVSPAGDYEIMEVTRGAAGVANLRDGISRAYDAGSTLVAYYATAVFYPDSLTPDSVVLEWDFGDDTIADVAVVVRRKLRPPITGRELLELYPRIKELGATEYAGDIGQRWVSQAWDIIAARLWQEGYILHHIRSADLLRGALLAQVRLLLADQGIDITGAADPIEAQRQTDKRVAEELARLMQTSVWIDRDDDMTADDGETIRRGPRLVI